MAYEKTTTISHRSSTERRRIQSKMSATAFHRIRQPAKYSHREEKWIGSIEIRGRYASPAVTRIVTAHAMTADIATLERMVVPTALSHNRLGRSASFKRVYAITNVGKAAYRRT